MPDLAISIVNTNTKDDTLRCLKSLREKSGNLDLEIVVTDNASTDGSVEAIETQFPEVQVIKNSENVGFGRACNQGARMTTAPIIFFLNPDTEIVEGSLEALIESFAAHPNAGIIGSVLLDPDGVTPQQCVRNLPTLRALLYQFTVLRWFGIFKDAFKRYCDVPIGFERTTPVESVMGASLAILRYVYDQIGGFDEAFFIYYEEVDVCKRTRDAGYEVFIEPASRILHLGGTTARSFRLLMAISRMESLLHYVRKHNSRLQAEIFKWTLVPLFTLRSLTEVPGLAVKGLRYTFFRKDAYRARRAFEKCKIALYFSGPGFFRLMTQ